MTNLLCSGDEGGILCDKTPIDFKVVLGKWILEPHVKSNKEAAHRSTGIKTRTLGKGGSWQRESRSAEVL